ncbi:hypothetical protein NDA13_005663 [Ustilago tritici]|nr:hypothetical protein NDA13_005663 [Ustilago tritici]
MNKLKQPCPFFQRGTCRFGDACRRKFLHDPLAWQEKGLNGKQSEQAMQAPQPSGPTAYGKFVQWRYHNRTTSLRIIAHDQVLSSSVLEARLGTLLNYLYGVNGKRSVAVFTAAIRGLTYEELSQAEFEPCLGENIGAAPNKSKHDHTRRKPTFELLILPTMGEILGDRAEYLPRSDPSTWHLQGAAGLLDRQFRLIREDTVGQLRDAARVELNRIQDPFEQTGASKHAGAHTYSYRNVRLIDVEMDPQKGLLCVLEFDQPRELINKSQSQSKEWWAESGRLAPEALIMLLGSDQIAVFLTVLAATFPSEASNKSERSIEKLYPRAGDQRTANVVESHKNLSFSLLEFPGVLLPAFKHTLEALQHMTLSEDLPFAELLAPTADSQHGTQVEAPAYTKRQGFSFDLSTLSTKHENETITLDVNSPMEADLLSAQTTLDHSQAEALISTLCRSVALIQGPPGTGKSYTGVALKVLMENKKAAKLGPVLCVTFTNHALDQILEHLVDAGVEQVIRIGSRSKSERLSALNLRAVAQKEPWTKLEARERWEHKQNVDHFRTLASEGLRELQDFSEASVLTYLKDRYPRCHAQLVGPEIDEDGFELVQNKRAAAGIAPWLQGAPRFSPMPGGNHTHDIFSLSVAVRQRLYSHWVEEILDPIQRSLLANLKAYEDAKAGINKIRAEDDHRVLEGANVIGVTTSGLARNLDLLRRLNSKVLVVEEAGEVSEAHLLTAMLPSIEHAILIGDHQ